MASLPGLEKIKSGEYTQHIKIPFHEYIGDKFMPAGLFDTISGELVRKKYELCNNEIRILTYNAENKSFADIGDGERSQSIIKISNENCNLAIPDSKTHKQIILHDLYFMYELIKYVRETGEDLISIRINKIKSELLIIDKIFIHIQENIITELNTKDDHLIFQAKPKKPLQTTFLDRYSDHDKIFDLIKSAKNIGLNISEVDEKKLMISPPCDRINDCNRHILQCLLIKITLQISNYKNYLSSSIRSLEIHPKHYSDIYAFNDIIPDFVFELSENNTKEKNIKLFEWRCQNGRLLFEKVYCIRDNNINAFVSKLIGNTKEHYIPNCYLLCLSKKKENCKENKWNVFAGAYGDPIKISEEEINMCMKLNEQMHENEIDKVIIDPKEVRRKNSIENKEENTLKANIKKMKREDNTKFKSERRNEKPNTSDDDSIEGSFNMFDE
jgi:hypothetical protein